MGGPKKVLLDQIFLNEFMKASEELKSFAVNKIEDLLWAFFFLPVI